MTALQSMLKRGEKQNCIIPDIKKTWDSRKCKLFFKDRKQVSGCLGWDELEEPWERTGIRPGIRKLWGEWIYSVYLDYDYSDECSTAIATHTHTHTHTHLKDVSGINRFVVDVRSWMIYIHECECMWIHIPCLSQTQTHICLHLPTVPQ